VVPLDGDRLVAGCQADVTRRAGRERDRRGGRRGRLRREKGRKRGSGRRWRCGGGSRGCCSCSRRGGCCSRCCCGRRHRRGGRSWSRSGRGGGCYRRGGCCGSGARAGLPHGFVRPVAVKQNRQQDCGPGSDDGRCPPGQRPARARPYRPALKTVIFRVFGQSDSQAAAMRHECISRPMSAQFADDEFPINRTVNTERKITSKCWKFGPPHATRLPIGRCARRTAPFISPS
jgi:hypothetical protein